MNLNSMERQFFLHAPNVHSGGGLTLLKALLKYLPKKAYLIIDERLPISDDELLDFCVYRIKPTLWHRFMAERLLSRLVRKGDSVFCFGNLPPLFSLKAQVTLFVQNRYLVEPKFTVSVPPKLRVRLEVERRWLRLFQKNVDKVIVQTPSMKILTSQYVASPVIVAPFAAGAVDLPFVKDDGNKKHDFIYVASGDLHKNHKNLVRAWVLLAQEGIFPSLCLTINPRSFPQMAAYVVKKSKKYNLKIVNAGKVEGAETLKLYKTSKNLIFPSVLESFGLPLLEARNEGLRIIASELDYVRDILDPDETFDPESPLSIARAIKRLMKLDKKPFTLIDGQEIIKLVTSG